MGLINDLKAAKDIQKIKNGGIAYLSISQITGLITNMLDAKRNLDNEKYEKIYNLFLSFRKCNTKIKMDLEGYYNTAIDIIKKFDAIAPYEKYSGGNETETSFLMEDIHKLQLSDKNNDYKFQTNNKIFSTNEKDEYANYLVENSYGILSRDDADNFIKVLFVYSVFGKEKALKEFDSLISKKNIQNDLINSFSKTMFLLGVLKSNGVIDSNELKKLSDLYQKTFLDNTLNSSK